MIEVILMNLLNSLYLYVRLLCIHSSKFLNSIKLNGVGNVNMTQVAVILH